MFDFPFTETSVITGCYCIAMYLAILACNINGVLYPFRKRQCKNQTWAILWIGFLIVTHCIQGDFFHFMETVQNYCFTLGAYNYGEEIYGAVSKIVNRNYFLFRLLVWGGAFWIFVLTAKRFNIPPYYAAVYIFAVYLVTFSYARVTAAMAVYFYGLSYFCVPTRYRYLGYLKGGLLIAASLLFHNTAMVLVALSFTVFIPFRKWSILALLILLPTISGLLRGFFEDYALSEAASEVISRKIQHYSDRQLDFGPAAIMTNTISYASFIIPTIICLYTYFFKYKGKVDKYLLKMNKVLFSIMVVAFSFLLMGSTFITFFYRIMFMTMIPLCIIVLRLYKEKLISRKQFLWCCLPGITTQVIRHLYNLYLSYI